jgi:hypothetical protein
MRRAFCLESGVFCWIGAIAIAGFDDAECLRANWDAGDFEMTFAVGKGAGVGVAFYLN